MNKTLRHLISVAGIVVALLAGGGLIFAITNEWSDHVNILDDKAFQFGTDLDIQILYDEAADNRLEFTDGTNLLMHLTDAGTTGNLAVTGMTNLVGAVNLGTAAATKGILTLERAAALNGYIEGVSSNGTSSFLFVDNAGNWRKHTAAPTADGDGTQLAVGSLNDLIDDLTPTLGGDLDVNGKSIVSVSAGDIVLTPNTTGDIIFDGQKWPQSDGTADQTLTTDGSGQLSWTSSGAGSLSNIVEDTTPELGGALDVNGKEITSASSTDIDLHSDGDVTIELGDAAGTNELSIRDSAGVEVAIIDSDGTAGFGTAAPAQKIHAFTNTTSPVRLRIQNSEGFADIAADDGHLKFFGSDGNEKLRLEASQIKAFQNFVPDIDISKDIGHSTVAWRNAYIRNIILKLQLEVGTSGTTRGVVSAWNGSGTNPGTLELESSDGTIHRYFAQNDGTLRVHSQLPTSNTDGSAVDTSATEVSADTSPVLGGNLDVGGFTITSASGGNIAITPDTTGSIVLDGVNWPQADGAANTTLTTNGSGQLTWTNVSAGIADVEADTSPTLGGNLEVNGKSIVSLSNGDITIAPNGTGDVIIDGLKYPQADGSAGQILKTDGSGQLAWATDGKSRFVTLYLSDQTDTEITTGTAKVTWRTPYAMTITKIKMGVKGVSSSGEVKVDINDAGTTVFSTELTIDVSEFTSEDASTAAVLSDTSWADDSQITFDIESAGTGADGLFVTILYDKT